MVGVVGVACSTVYLRTGSALGATLVHYAFVAPWLLFLGGLRTMQPDVMRAR